MSKKQKHFDSYGFTIVELIVAIAVGGIFIGSIASMIANNANLSQKGRDLTVVNAFSENKLEGLRSQGYLSLNNGTTNITSELPPELQSPRTGSVVISSQTPSTKKVMVSVTYNEQGTPRTYSYTTYIGELGVGQY